jgi:hypothetical protein
MWEIKEPGLKRLDGFEGKGNKNSITSVDFFVVSSCYQCNIVARPDEPVRTGVTHFY